MQTFRAYLINAAGKVTWGEWIEAESQAEAEAKAHDLCDGGSPIVELWLGGRRLAKLPCNEMATSKPA